MLVYANSLTVPASTGSADCVLAAIDSWLLFKTRKSLTASAYVNRPPVRLADGKELEVHLSGDRSKGQTVRGCVVFSHPDDRVSGRKWFTRIGFSQETADANGLVTVVTETSDISAQAGASRVFATRPGVIRNIVGKCGIVHPSPPANVFELTPESAELLADEIHDLRRRHAIIEISPEPFSERVFVNPQTLLDKVVGLARVAIIRNKAFTWAISEIMGNRYSVWGGAVNVIMPPFPNGYVTNQIISLDQLRYETGRDKAPEDYLLYLLTHRLNLPHYQQEVTPASVRQHALDLKLTELRASQASAEQLKQLVELTEAQIEEKNQQIQRLQDENSKAWSYWQESECRVAEIPKLREEISAYRAAFAKLKDEGRLAPDAALPIGSVADAIEAAKLKFAEELSFSLNAKSDGHESIFEAPKEVFEAFEWLATTYYNSKTGKVKCADLDGDLSARISGWHYSGHQKEATMKAFKEWYQCPWGVSPNGKLWIPEHLKGGATRSRRPEETIRIAFTFEPSAKKVVIGFIGQHQENSKS